MSTVTKLAVVYECDAQLLTNRKEIKLVVCVRKVLRRILRGTKTDTITQFNTLKHTYYNRIIQQNIRAESQQESISRGLTEKEERGRPKKEWLETDQWRAILQELKKDKQQNLQVIYLCRTNLYIFMVGALHFCFFLFFYAEAPRLNCYQSRLDLATHFQVVLYLKVFYESNEFYFDNRQTFRIGNGHNLRGHKAKQTVALNLHTIPV